MLDRSDGWWISVLCSSHPIHSILGCLEVQEQRAAVARNPLFQCNCSTDPISAAAFMVGTITALKGTCRLGHCSHEAPFFLQGTPVGNAAAANGSQAAPSGTPLPGGLRSAGSGVGLGAVPG